METEFVYIMVCAVYGIGGDELSDSIFTAVSAE
jgi:hypothetical protein